MTNMIVSDHLNVRSMNCGVIQSDQYRKFVIIVVIRKNILEYPKKIYDYKKQNKYRYIPLFVKKIYINNC